MITELEPPPVVPVMQTSVVREYDWSSVYVPDVAMLRIVGLGVPVERAASCVLRSVDVLDLQFCVIRGGCGIRTWTDRSIKNEERDADDACWLARFSYLRD